MRSKKFLAKRNKYKNKKVIVDGIKFDSKKEATVYQELKLLEKVGRIRNLRRQVRFELVPKTDKFSAVTYIADFTYEDDSGLHVIDVKSYFTRKMPLYIVKKKLMYYRYGLLIEEW